MPNRPCRDCHNVLRADDANDHRQGSPHGRHAVLPDARSRDHECGRLHAHYRHVHRCIGRDWLRLRPMNALRRRQQTSDGANAHREENRYGLRA